MNFLNIIKNKLFQKIQTILIPFTFVHSKFKMDRKCEILQYKIQQQLTLQSDEVERLRNLMISLKNEIITARDKIQNLDNEINLAKQFKKGRDKRFKISHEADLSKLIITHHQAIQVLSEEQEREIQYLQNYFSKTLDEITKNQENLGSDKFVTIQRSIDEAKAKLSATISMSETIVNTPSDPLDVVMLETQNERIKQLQNMLMTKNKERNEGLRQSKKQLTICVEALEDIDHNYEVNATHLHSELDKIDSKYKIDISQLTDNHHHRLVMLKEKLKEAKLKFRAAQKSLERIQNNNRQAMSLNMRQMEIVKATTVPPSKFIRDENEEIKFKELQKVHQNTRKNLQQKSQNLQRAREVNESLKRQINSLLFQQRFGIVPNQ